MENKICKKCGEEKDIEEFPIHSKNIRRSICKICYTEIRKEYYLNNKKKLSNKCKIYYEKNKEQIKSYIKEYSLQNKEVIKIKRKEYRNKNKDILSEKSKIFYQNNKEKIKEKVRNYKIKHPDKIKESYEKNKEYYYLKNKKRRETHKEEESKNFKKYYSEHKEYFKEYRKKYYNSEKGKATKLKWCNEYNSKNKHIVLWRTLLRRTIIQLKQEKTANTETMLGYTAIELKTHIENLWLEGMSWDNYGDWHVDHIRSVATFEPNIPASIVNALSNLQPMWSTTRIIDGVLYEGNLNKGKKYN